MRILFFWLVTLLNLSWAETLDESFSELLSSDKTFDNREEILRVKASLWEKYLAKAKEDTSRKLQHEERKLILGDKSMRFSLEKRGVQGPSGYPVYIALHGGGGAPAYVNDSQWQHMKIYYRDSVENGIYIAPRGISDTWNLHFMDESYALYDRLIENLIAYEGADPNRIYLLGFSAGGDGVYQVVPRMPDRFAAANMSAGHHNSIRFDNLLNTPFLLQVGERDGAYNRNKVAAENYGTLSDLKARYQGFVHDLFIHANGNHNGWYDNDASGSDHPIIKNPTAWLLSNDRTQESKNTNAIHWLKNYQRASLPLKLIWDLSTRSPRAQTWGAQYVTNASAVSETRDLFYWLALDKAVDAGRIEAQINREDNAVVLNEVSGISTFKILLSNEIFDFSRPVKVIWKGVKIAEVSPKAKMSVMARSLLERGDRSFMFQDEIKIELPKLQMLKRDTGKFSYCTDGRCTFMTAQDFQRARNFPLDLNYTCKKDHQYALTFDDGPTLNYPAVLDILDRHGVKATFFINGMHLANDQGKELVRKAASAGHQIANHTFYHRSLVELSREEVISELKDNQNAILDVLGDNKATRLASSIVRPPFGNMSPEVQEIVKELGFTSVRWNSDRYDWKLSSQEGSAVKDRLAQHLSFLNNSVKNDFNRSIIDLNHDGSAATISVLDEMIPLIKDAGFELVSVSECLGLKE